MALLQTTIRSGLRGMLGILLALHLCVAQAGLRPTPTPPSADGPSSAPCHLAAASAGAVSTGGMTHVPRPAHAPGCCDPGQCHCPVAIAYLAPVVPQGRLDFRRVASDAAYLVALSRRLAPDLRPPITA